MSGVKLNSKKAFDADLPPTHPANKKAADDHQLTYKPDLRAYVDQEGCLIRDDFGQLL